MKAITVKYRSPSNVRGARWIATDSDKNRVITGYDYALTSDENARRAANALCLKMNWTGTLALGHTADAYVFVFVEPHTVATIPARGQKVTA